MLVQLAVVELWKALNHGIGVVVSKLRDGEQTDVPVTHTSLRQLLNVSRLNLLLVIAVAVAIANTIAQTKDNVELLLDRLELNTATQTPGRREKWNSIG